MTTPPARADMPQLMQLLVQVRAHAREAAARILAVYQGQNDPAVSLKADRSPLTEADRQAHDYLVQALPRLASGWPVLSEESAPVSFAERQRWTRYWLVDPLDGTREFIERNGEFTVNIALIEDHRPILGVVHVPVTGVSYCGVVGLPGQQSHACRIVGEDSQSIKVKALVPGQPELRVVASRHHRSEALLTCIENLRRGFPNLTEVSMGSALKICLVAEGLADIYPRLGPTSEWDTAAAHAVLTAAGGALVDDRFQELRYNTGPRLLNPSFFAFGDRQLPWQALCGLEDPGRPVAV